MLFVSIACWAAAWAVWHLVWTASLAVLSLTTPDGESFELALFKALVVLFTWFGAVLVAPVLTLTSVAWTLLERGANAPQREGTGDSALSP
mgnify:FL=1